MLDTFQVCLKHCMAGDGLSKPCRFQVPETVPDVQARHGLTGQLPLQPFTFFRRPIRVFCLV